MPDNRTPSKWPYRAAKPVRRTRVVKTSAGAGVLRPQEASPRFRITPKQARLALGGVFIAMLAAGAWWAYHSPYLTVHEIEVVGAQRLSPAQITDAADIRTSALRTAADSVCACGTDQDCLSREYRKLRKIAVDYEGALLLPAEKAKVDEYSRRAKLCAMQPVAPAAETETAAPAPASP